MWMFRLKRSTAEPTAAAYRAFGHKRSVSVTVSSVVLELVPLRGKKKKQFKATPTK